ncbi:MAG: saccharopine dehydrogenase NADP-binding domain-containing protein [Chitinophagaceae bacterium]|nr:saccharopine dehydrogenase NADP-binding domain-containing protein [Chitinophagaceae bacterium]
MKQILLFGAGKSATVLIDYLLAGALANNWKLTVVDANLQLALDKINNSPSSDQGRSLALSFDINDSEKRKNLISSADIVISMLPPALHFQVANDCVEFSKHLLTASYVDDSIRSLRDNIREKNILFLCEMGLDPGIDHMSAMKIIEDIHERGGRITSFKSHCGGLVAPESDDNPWHYKISWNPRNIVLAGKAGAHYREKGEEVRMNYEQLFAPDRVLDISGAGFYSWYPNRDSLSYTSLYGLEGADTFIRTTLRHPDFMYGWKNIVDLQLTDEQPAYDTDGKSLAAVFKEHLDKNNFGEWLKQKMSDRFKETQDMLTNLTKLMEAEKEAEEGGEDIPGSFISADAKGNLEEIEIEDIKTKAAAFVAYKMHEANLTLKQLVFLGLDDENTQVNKGVCSAADVLQFALERKLSLQPTDKDMVVMLHEFEYMIGEQLHTVNSSLVVKGEDNLRTAMAKTVGLPLAIAAKLILNGQIKTTGLQIPTSRDIYEPVLRELEAEGIKFVEK